MDFGLFLEFETRPTASQAVVFREDLDGIVAELNPGGLVPLERVKRSLEILAHEVMPVLKNGH